MAKTRTFVLEGETRRFWDISWDGPSVEITSGKWGTNGRAREELFASPGEREAFVDSEIAKIVKKGYVETNAVAPAPDFSTPTRDKQAAALRARIEKLARPAWTPVFAPSASGEGRVRAPMMLDRDEAWPACRHCSRPLSGIFELEMSRLPATHLRRDGVAQMFWCEAWEQDGGDVCTATSGYLARWHRESARRADGPRMRDGAISIVDWQRHDELPHDAPAEIKALLDEGDPELVTELLRSVGAAIEDDFDAFNAFARGVGRAARNVHKLAGYPTFVQECTVPFEHALFQIEMQPPFDINLGDVGAAQLLVDRRGELRLFWACH